MRTRAHIFLIASVAALLATSAAAEVDLGPAPDDRPGDAPGQAAPPPPTLPPAGAAPKAPRVAAPPGTKQPGAKQKGDPGMMGLPWPKSPEDASKTLQSLYAHLATTDDHRLGGDIGAAIEKLWRLSGGDTVNLLLDRAEAFTARTEYAKALPLLDAAVDLAPDYADAWNRRAYTYYRMGNTEAALGDLRRALALEPNHFRALDGMAKILAEIGEKKAALKAYEQLLKIHPNIEGAEPAAAELRKAVEGQGI